MNNYIMEFKNMIGNCQNFLTLIIFNIGANNSDEEEEEEAPEKKEDEYIPGKKRKID